MPKRIFYFDEDTYLALVGDHVRRQRRALEARGKLPDSRSGSWGDGRPISRSSMYDLVTGRYVCDQSSIGTGKDMHYHADSNDPRFKSGWYHGRKPALGQ